VDNLSLLDSYMKVRSISEQTREAYLTAMKKWISLQGTSLDQAGIPEVKRWYTSASTEIAHTTMLGYATRLRQLHRHGFVLRGESKKKAKVSADEIWDEAVPFTDLYKEANSNMGDRDKVITSEELMRILEVVKHPRPKALVAVLFDSACRKDEILSLRIRDVSFGATWTELRVVGKTGERTVPLVFSVPYLKAWLQVHPDRRSDQYLFVSTYAGRLEALHSGAVNSTLRYICLKQGLRHIYPHMFRHTKLTELARMDVGEYQMKSFAGWTPDSRMARRYIHLSGRDHINKVLEAQGIEVPKASRPVPMLMSGHCPSCDALIGPSMLYCPGCGYVLDPNLQERVTPGSTTERINKLGEEMRRLLAEFEELKEEKS